MFVCKLPTPTLHTIFFFVGNADLSTDFGCYLQNSSVDKLDFSCSDNGGYIVAFVVRVVLNRRDTNAAW